MDLAIGLVLLVAVAAAGAWVAERFHLSAPLVLIGIGIVGALQPFVPEVELDPEVVLVGLLPPLLYSTAIRTSIVSLRTEWPSIALLSVGLVVFTALGVGVLVAWLLPIPLAAAVALGAVVAPPDAVAATAVARKVGMPRRITTILEGESLLNDATALVVLHTAIAAMEGHVTSLEVARDFVVAAGGGALIGIGAAYALGFVRRRVHDPVLDTTLSFLAPFAAYLPAEEVHASGVVAAVVCGLILGQHAYEWQGATSRVAERLNWRTVAFILEHVVFLLIGLQTWRIIRDAWATPVSGGRIVATALAVLVAVIALRMVWVMACNPLLQRRRRDRPDRRESAVVGWAGMRGVVTLAAALVLPAGTELRNVLILAALVVVGGTLAIQGPTLPGLMRRLGLRGPTAAEDALQVAALAQQAGHHPPGHAQRRAR